MSSDQIPEQVFLDAAKAHVEVLFSHRPLLSDATLKQSKRLGFRAAVESAYRAGQAAAPDWADFWFKVAVNTATRYDVPCPRCTHPTKAHWPDDERGQPGCHRPDCLCSWTPQELLIAADAVAREVRHVAEFMSGYMSPCCLNGMDGCDDRACICRCHEEAEAVPDVPRTWALPDEPGPEVRRLRPVERYPGDNSIWLDREPDNTGWRIVMRGRTGEPMEWVQAYGIGAGSVWGGRPLTDATPAGGQDVDGVPTRFAAAPDDGDRESW